MDKKSPWDVWIWIPMDESNTIQHHTACFLRCFDHSTYSTNRFFFGRWTSDRLSKCAMVGSLAPSGPEEWMRATNIRRMELEVWVCLAGDGWKWPVHPRNSIFWWGKWCLDNMDFGWFWGFPSLRQSRFNMSQPCLKPDLALSKHGVTTVTTVYAKSTGQSSMVFMPTWSPDECNHHTSLLVSCWDLKRWMWFRKLQAW